LGHAPTGTGTIAFDPTFGSFTLLEPISHYSNKVLFFYPIAGTLCLSIFAKKTKRKKKGGKYDTL
jgi:cytochrome c-type biogenesis protein CcmH/NrfF